MKQDYTGKYTVGQTVYINDKRSHFHGRQFVIQAINPKKAFPYQVDDLWYPERELSAEPTVKPPKAQAPQPTQEWQSMDIDGGLGIGGINNDQSMPFVPSASAIERVQRLHDTDTVCRRCGASKNFDGAMFTNFGGSDICDDCA